MKQDSNDQHGYATNVTKYNIETNTEPNTRQQILSQFKIWWNGKQPGYPKGRDKVIICLMYILWVVGAIYNICDAWY